ncbi:MAG: hypothetical protein MKZ95_00895 [Pirellulales bacterium]|nr:hypothetical protein [Pirellulales bacterium]HCK40251.1 hypothetical protein [Planctomycetaceae bacterium]
MSRTNSKNVDPLAAPSLVKTLAPEDICISDFVAPLYETYDYPSFCWCGDSVLTDRQQTVRIEFPALV